MLGDADMAHFNQPGVRKISCVRGCKGRITQNKAIYKSMSHQRTMPSPMALKREAELASMGRACLQSGAFSSAVLSQLTNAYRSSSAQGSTGKLSANTTSTTLYTFSHYMGIMLCFTSKETQLLVLID